MSVCAEETVLPAVLSIAGSDPSGGAGIQADLKTFLCCGVYGMSVITSVVAENTTGVQRVYDLPGELILAQIESVCSDIPPAAVEVGMLSGLPQIRAVTEGLRRFPPPHLVLDPVMAAKDGTPLLQPEAVRFFVRELLPVVTLLTPNVPEAELLAGIRIESEDARREAARKLVKMGAGAVLIKGGHLSGSADDLLYDGQNFTHFDTARIDTIHTHGTGCTLSSAIASALARGLPLPEAALQAKAYLTETMLHALAIGHGHGPLNHGAGKLPLDR